MTSDAHVRPPGGKGPAALVLGGGGGIGAAVCRRLGRDFALAFTFLTHEDRARDLAEELGAGERVVRAIRCDATDESDVVAAFDLAEELGPLQAVVHCVGGWDYPRLSDLTVDQIRSSLDLNLGSGLLVLRECARRVVDGGRVVMVSSASAHVAPARQSTYAAAKAGLEVAARVAAKELAPRGVTVNVVRPGATDTETLRTGTSGRAIEAMAGANAMRRLGQPDDVAAVVSMLVSPDVGWMTGTVVDATGGLY